MHDDTSQWQAADSGFMGQMGGESRDEELARRVFKEIVVLRSACLGLILIGIAGAMLHRYHLIPYWPVFPLAFLLGSLVSISAAVKANWYARHLGSRSAIVLGFLRTAGAGGFVGLLVSGISIVAAVLRVSGSVASGGTNLVLLAISWPTAVISVLGLLAAALVMWIYREPGRLPHHAGS